MTQADILAHYESEWERKSDAARDAAGLGYSNPVEDTLLYETYRRLISDLGLRADGGSILDVGCGSGRWIRFFLEHYRPESVLGIDYTKASVELLKKWHGSGPVKFLHGDITDSQLDLGRTFDLVNVANVLFHIPEPELFMQALRNLARLVNPGGRIVTTEYLPHATMRTEWMLVRSRYEFDAAIAECGLEICDIRAFSFFANDPMGIDGPDQAVRQYFHKVRAGIQTLMTAQVDDHTKGFFIEFLVDVERATVSFARERLAEVDLPSQKLVVLRRI